MTCHHDFTTQTHTWVDHTGQRWERITRRCTECDYETSEYVCLGKPDDYTPPKNKSRKPGLAYLDYLRGAR